jgi:hypothetical protein
MATKCESLSVWPIADSAPPTRESTSARVTPVHGQQRQVPLGAQVRQLLPHR